MRCSMKSRASMHCGTVATVQKAVDETIQCRSKTLRVAIILFQHASDMRRRLGNIYHGSA